MNTRITSHTGITVSTHFIAALKIHRDGHINFSFVTIAIDEYLSSGLVLVFVFVAGKLVSPRERGPKCAPTSLSLLYIQREVFHLDPELTVIMVFVPVAANNSFHFSRIVRLHRPAVARAHSRPFCRYSEPNVLLVRHSPAHGTLDASSRRSNDNAEQEEHHSKPPSLREYGSSRWRR